MSKIIDLAKKLKALAERGEGGEKDNAEKILHQLLHKHNLTKEDIEGEKIDYYFFRVTSMEARLLHQIVKKVNHQLNMYGELPKYKQREFKKIGYNGNYFLKSTAFEYIEIQAKFNFFNNLFVNEQEVFFTAFCSANDLLVSPKNADERQYSMEEIENYKRSLKMAENIQKGQYLRQLTPSIKSPP